MRGLREEGVLSRCPRCGGQRLRLRSEVVACYDARIVAGKVSWQSNRLVLVNPARISPKATIICLDCLATFAEFELLENGTVILKERGG